MFVRLVSLLLFAGTGALFGGLFMRIVDTSAPLWGALAGCSLWAGLDALYGSRLVVWLRNEAAGQAHPDANFGGGIWKELAERIRKQIRAKNNALKESETRLQDFLEALQASPNGVVLLDEEGRMEWFNQTAATHFGFEVHRDEMQHFGNLVREPVFAQYLSSGDWSSGVVMPGRQNTASKPVRLMVHLHPYGDGRKLLLSRDITPLEQAEAMRRDFVANVSHEIRTPLTVLAGFVETMQTLPLQESDKERYLDLMAQQTQRMQSLVNDLLTLSRLEGNPPPGFQDWVSLDVLMDQCIHDAHVLSQHLYGRKRDVEFSLEPGFEIAGAMNELQSAMGNLVANALRYCGADAPIKVKWAQTPSGDFCFSVTDGGPGIAPEHLPRLTERFYRVDRSRSRESGGTGLGLAIVKHVAQRHGATLRIESQPGVGSTFAISFPAGRVRLKQLQAA